MDKKRCQWSDTEELHAYHDCEWGVPVHDDAGLFENLSLSGVQAGLSWSIVLKRRDAYREAFHYFSPSTVAGFDEAKVEELLQNADLIRNRQKMNAIIANAKAVVAIQNTEDSFDHYLWDFVDQKPIQNSWQPGDQIPTQTELSVLLSKDLKKRGFKFVGPVICYAFMESVGLVNDHTVDCFRYKALAR